MGVFDKFLDIMKLNDDDYDDDFYDEEDEYFDDEEFDEKPARRSLFGKKNTKEESFDDFDMEEEKKFQPASSSKVTPMRHPASRKGGNMEVCVVKPSSVDDSREITETLLSGRTVILNLEGMDLELAQRIIDFISGVKFPFIFKTAVCSCKRQQSSLSDIYRKTKNISNGNGGQSV